MLLLVGLLASMLGFGLGLGHKQDFRTYTITSNIYLGQSMIITSAVTGVIDMESGWRVYRGQLRDVQLQGKPLQAPSAIFQFSESNPGTFSVSKGLSKSHVLIIKGIVNQFTVHGRDAPIGSFGVNEEETIMGRCNTTWGERKEKSVKKHIFIGNCKDLPVYFEGVENWPSYKARTPRSITTEVFFDEKGNIEKIKTDEDIISFDLEEIIKIVTEIKTVDGPYSASKVSLAVIFSENRHTLSEKDWRDEMTADDFCSRVFSMAGQVKLDSYFEKPGLGEIPKTQVLESYTLMRKSIRHAPSGSGVLRDCFNKFLTLEPPTEMKQVEKIVKVATSGMVQSGIPDSINFLSFLLQNNNSTISAFEISQMANNVPSYMLTAFYLRSFYKLTKKALESDLPEDQKTALIITFSQIVRKAVVENPSPEIRLDTKTTYLPFFDLNNPDKAKIGRESVFIRAYGNVPHSKSLNSFKNILKMYKNDPHMKVFIISCMDKLADEYPMTTFRTLKDYMDTDAATTAAAVIQMMRTRLVSVEMLENLLMESTLAPLLLRESLQQVLAACVYGDAYGPEMRQRCEKATRDTVLDAKYVRSAKYFKDLAVSESISSKNVKLLYYRARTNGFWNMSMTFTKLQGSFVVILETNYMQIFINDYKGLLRMDFQDMMTLTSSEAFVSYPTTCGLPAIQSAESPSLFRFKVMPARKGGSVTGVLSTRTQEKFGLLDNFNKKEIVLGLDSNFQVYLPKISAFNFNPQSLNINLAHPKKNHRLFHESTWPYVVKNRDVFHALSSGDDPDVSQNLKQLVLKETFDYELLREITGVSIQDTIKSEKLEEDRKMIFCGGPPTHHLIRNVWYKGNSSTTDTVILHLEPAKALSSFWELQVTDHSEFFTEAGVPGHLWSFAARAEAHIRFDGSIAREYSAGINSAFTNSGNRFFSLLLRKSIDDNVEYEICSDLAIRSPETAEDVTKMFAAIEYGQTCRQGSNLTISVVTKSKNLKPSDFDQGLVNTTIVHQNTPDIVVDILCRITDKTTTFKPELECLDPSLWTCSAN